MSQIPINGRETWKVWNRLDILDGGREFDDSFLDLLQVDERRRLNIVAHNPQL
jgi:hypothetical protein